MSLRPRRSVLYMPGSNGRALEKAKSIAADTLILDLEDAVAPDAKAIARQQVADAVRSKGYGRRELVIRVNGETTPWFDDDLAAAVAANPDAILIPKVGTPEMLMSVGEKLAKLGAGADLRVWAMLETPLGVLNAQAIAQCAKRFPGTRIAAFVMGTNDLAKETRAEFQPGRAPFVPWLMTCVAAARAYGIDIIDGTYNNFRDVTGLRAECEQGRSFGFDGKTLIHPDQVAVANEIFSPPEAEVEWARRVIAAFEDADNKGKGVINLEGRMVELLHADMARRTVAIADAIRAMT
jgi:citrate lyase subunit beta/citryl-CoA lyase